MYFSVLLILSRLFIVHGAPKLGNVLFDPIELEAAKHIPGTAKLGFDVSSSEDFLENKPSKEITRPPAPMVINQINIQKGTDDNVKMKTINKLKNVELLNKLSQPALRQGEVVVKFGYDFDPSICQEINSQNRILCGYNKNVGEIPKEHPIIPTSNNCQIRAGRIECGYVKGGYILALRRRLAVTPVLNSMASYNPHLMSRIVFPKVSPQLLSTLQSETTSKPTSHLKNIVTNSITPLPSTVRLTGARLSTSELTSGKMTASLLTSRSGIVSSKITEETKHGELIRKPSTMLREAAPLPAISVENTVTKTLQEKPIARNNEELDAIIKQNGDCTPCALKALKEKKALRNSEGETGTTEPSVTRCVEIRERIVCYPLKIKSTVATVAT